MKKLFIISDIHSFYDELLFELEKANFDINNNDHIIVSLGDLFDRGPKANELLNFINSLPDTRRICIIGNHELLLEDILKTGLIHYYDYLNGTIETIKNISGQNNLSRAIEEMINNERWKQYRNSWRFYFEIKDYIFVHGWIPSIYKKSFNKIIPIAYDENWRNQDIDAFKDATWLNGMECYSKGIYEKGKTIFCGHWHTSYGHSNLHHNGPSSPKTKGAILDPFVDEGIVALDACTALSNKVNVYTLDIEDDIWLKQ